MTATQGLEALKAWVSASALWVTLARQPHLIPTPCWTLGALSDKGWS